ncbi:MAG: dihydroorotate dehydrogenase [Spirochaetales bacterium]|nr:dihydroorotate dehydrogenase [Spirochaetales bacterium]
MDLSFTLRNKSLETAIGVASGTFGYGSEYEKLVDLSKIGAIFTKTVTLNKREGNDFPRIVETPSGMLNAIGLANVGIESFISQKLPMLQKMPCETICNIAGFSMEEYQEVLQKLEDSEAANFLWGYEINISCPNVCHGGLAFGVDVKAVETLTKALRQRTEKPLIIKLTPNVTDISEIAKAAEANGADALTCINTFVGMLIDIRKKIPVLANKTGGLSGPAILPLGIAAAYKVCRAVSIPVIGLGGISRWEDAIQYFMAGAKMIQVGTATFVDPSAPEKILLGVKKYCSENNYSKLSDLKID